MSHSAAATPDHPSASLLPPDTPSISAGRTWLLHLWAFFLPLVNLGFLLGGPYPAWQALVWTGVVWTLVAVDNRAPNDLRQPPARLRSWPYDLQVYALVALQLLNHVMVGVMAARLSWWPLPELGVTLANLFAVMVVSGVTAGYSGIVVAHELVHRRSAHQHFLGRLLLVFVLYEHFATEHVRGHHPRVGTRQDPATARYGETFRTFFLRTVPQQFVSAWKLEKVRLGDPAMKLTDPRMLRHRVLQGVVAEVGLVIAYWVVFGFGALVFFVLQARTAIMLLEVVNYIEHWGLTRRGKTVTPLDSWDTDNWFTLYTLVGLSRHSDHHARASRPYQLLRHFPQSPKMPRGYYGTIVMALLRNEKYQQLATEELQRRGLGPFREDAGATRPAPAEPPPAREAASSGLAEPA